ncbi:MAG TPA: phage major capsid protein [Acidimicrobiales bacterium]|nr:phage major capsid protein [Acidimicrobiales bacterium]
MSPGGGVPARVEQRNSVTDIMRRHEDSGARLAQGGGPALTPARPPSEGRTVDADRVFERFLRFGVGSVAAEDRALLVRDTEFRDQTAGTNSAGGYLVPPGYWQRISEVLKAYGGLYGLANVVMSTTGNPIQWPNNDDTANAGSILGEATQVAELDLTIGTRTLGAYTYTSGLIRVSNQLLEDSAFDLGTWFNTRLSVRIARAIANHLVNGTGTNQPTGILPSVRTGVTGATGQTTTVIYDDVVDLIHSVDAAYRQLGRCAFVMNDQTVGVVDKIKDQVGRPLFVPAPTENAPATIMGYPVVVDNAMPIMSAGAKSILFGDFYAGMVVRQVSTMAVHRLVERYADFNESAMVAFMRADARPDDPNAVAAYANSAS